MKLKTVLLELYKKYKKTSSGSKVREKLWSVLFDPYLNMYRLPTWEYSSLFSVFQVGEDFKSVLVDWLNKESTHKADVDEDIDELVELIAKYKAN